MFDYPNYHHYCVDADDGDEFREFALVSPDSIYVPVEQILEELLVVVAVPTDFDSLDAELGAATQTLVHPSQCDSLALLAYDYFHVARRENLDYCAFLC